MSHTTNRFRPQIEGLEERSLMASGLHSGLSHLGHAPASLAHHQAILHTAASVKPIQVSHKSGLQRFDINCLFGCPPQIQTGDDSESHPPQGPSSAGFPSYQLGADEKANFIVQSGKGSFTRSAVDKVARNAIKGSNGKNSAPWDNKYWRWPVANGKYLLVIWNNQSRNFSEDESYGWAAVQIKGSSSFKILYSDGSKATINDGQSDAGNWSANGDTIYLRFYNPRNENGNRKNDIHYQIGYPT